MTLNNDVKLQNDYTLYITAVTVTAMKLLRCSFIHICHTPLRVHSAKSRHQSPEWTILSHVNCFIQGEAIGFQVLMDSFNPFSMGASPWSAPVLQERSC